MDRLDTAKVTISEDPNRVTVVLAGRTHSGSWNDEEEVEADEGSDEPLLRSALLAWEGEDGEHEQEVGTLEDQGHWTAP